MTDPRRDYLRELDAALVGPRRTRRSLLQEASDHLDDATAALVAAGHDRPDAARRAVADFGTVADVAPGFQATLAVAASRRTAWLLLLVLGYQPFLWDSGVRLSERTHQPTPPDVWVYPLLDEAIEVAGGLVLLGALLAVLVTGVGNRWASVGPATARVTARFALVAIGVVVGLAVAMALVSGGATPAFWAALLVLMALPLSGVAASARLTLSAA